MCSVIVSIPDHCLPFYLQTFVPALRKRIGLLLVINRPVSLTCVPYKLREHIVCSNIIAHLDGNQLLSDRQHALRKRHM